MTAQEAELKRALTEAGVFAILFTTEKACHAADFAALVKAELSKLSCWFFSSAFGGKST